MTTITVRNLDAGLKTALRVQAARHGRSMEEEVRQILQANVATVAGGTAPTGAHIADAIASLFAPFAPLELEIAPRSANRAPPDFSGPDYDPDAA